MSTTILTVQVTDADSQTWNNGTYTATLTAPAAEVGGPYYVGTVLVTPITVSGTIGATGAFTVTLTDTNSITSPPGSTWALTVCPGVSGACYVQNLVVTGATQSITVVPPGVRVNMVTGIQAFAPPARVTGYLDGEMSGANIGSMYWNVTLQALRVLVSLPNNWQSIGSGNSLYEVVVYLPTPLYNNAQEIFRLLVEHTLAFGQNFAGAAWTPGGSSKIAPTSTAAYVVNQNGSQVGTITYASGSTGIPVFSTSSPSGVTFIPGDIMTIIGPAAPDPTHANFSFTLPATRTN